jgi:hypothetical protein
MGRRKEAPSIPVDQFIIRQLRKKAMNMAEVKEVMVQEGYGDDVKRLPAIIQKARSEMSVIVYSHAKGKYTSKPSIMDMFTWLRSRRRHSYTALIRAQGAIRWALDVPISKVPQEIRKEWRGLLESLKKEVRVAEDNGVI